MRIVGIAFLSILVITACAAAEDPYQGPNTAIEETSAGPLYVTPVFHGSVMFEHSGLVVHVDPYSRGDYSDKPKADLILITHEHRDHLDASLIEKLKKPETVIVGTKLCAESLAGIKILANGEEGTYLGILVRAVPAYNLVRERSPGVKFHPKGNGNGYVIKFADKQVYVAGDTEFIPAMKELEDIDIAFLPCNLPYTMTPEEVAECARAFKPRILYPYHYGSTDVSVLKDMLKDEPGIEVRIVKLN